MTDNVWSYLGIALLAKKNEYIFLSTLFTILESDLSTENYSSKINFPTAKGIFIFHLEIRKLQIV
jgi:hypothetical protein